MRPDFLYFLGRTLAGEPKAGKAYAPVLVPLCCAALASAGAIMIAVGLWKAWRMM